MCKFFVIRLIIICYGVHACFCYNYKGCTPHPTHGLIFAGFIPIANVFLEFKVYLQICFLLHIYHFYFIGTCVNYVGTKF